MSLINLSANFWTISITFFPDGFVAWLDSLIDGMFAEADLAFFLIWLLAHLTQEACESYCRQNNRQHASLNNLTTALSDKDFQHNYFNLIFTFKKVRFKSDFPQFKLMFNKLFWILLLYVIRFRSCYH